MKNFYKETFYGDGWVPSHLNIICCAYDSEFMHEIFTDITMMPCVAKLAISTFF
jgi:hypothetical protein